MRISVLLPYYGSLPKWTPLFLSSAGRNPGVQFLIVTDQPIGVSLPRNASCVPMPLGELERRARETVSPGFSVSYGYKLCDLRPFYGLVFQDLLRASDFWGYCDLDMVFGDLTPLLSSGRLDDADFYSADAGPAVGTFSLYRNTELMNSLGRRIPDYVRLLNSPENYVLDEIELNKVLKKSSDVRYRRAERLQESQLSITAYGRMVGRTSGVVGDPNEFYWSDGRTYIKSPGHPPQEVMYLHFIGLKRSYHWDLYDPSVEYREFAFSAAGFQPWRTPPTAAAALERKCKGLALKTASWGRSQVASRLRTQNRHRLKAWLSKAGL